MDWPIDNNTATIVSLSDGTASLYTTSKFGIIGGQAHPTVRVAARKFIQAAERLHDDSKETKTFPYPTHGKVRFYLRTFSGVRVIETEAEPIYSGASKYSQLFSLGQEVLTELRKATENRP